MRVINDEILDLIAGGSAEASIPSVTITGHVSDYEGSVTMPGGYNPSPGSGGVSNPEGPAPEPVKPCTVTHSSKPPPAVPEGVNLNDLRNMMVAKAAEIKLVEKDIEHGFIVVRTASGELKASGMYHGDAISIKMDHQPIAGEKIVGYIHSHPEDSINQKRPSWEDFEMADKLRNNTAIADKAMLLYIMDIKTGHVFEYHAQTPHSTKREGANVSTDLVKGCG